VRQSAVGAHLADGDFDADGDVDWRDLQLLQAHFGGSGSAGSGSIPEPGAAILLIFGARPVADGAGGEP